MKTNATVFSIVLVFAVVMAGIGPAAAMGTTTPATAAVSASIADGPVMAQTDAGGNCSFPVTATDATGTMVTIENEPQRIVTLAPSAAQTLWEIGAREKVVGVSQYASYLEGTETLTVVSSGMTYNIEEIVGLEPDLVLAPYIISNQTVKKLRSAGVTVFKFEAAESIEDVYEKTRLIGRLVGACEGADRIVTAMKERVSTIRTAVADKPEPNVLYGANFVAGNNTFIGSIIELAGGENVAANAGIEGFAKISEEVVANRTIEWIVVTSPGAVPNGTPWTSTIAVQQNQIIVVNTNYISQPAPRVVLALTKIAKALHPTAMQSANISETPIGPANLSMMNATTEQPVATDGGNATATATTMATATATGTTTTGVSTAVSGGTTGATAAPSGSETMATDGGTNQTGGNQTTTSSGNGPGFGVVVAVVALLGAALLARRRT